MTAVLRGGERSGGMELERARTLLTELADGVDPLTGECLPPDSVCNRPEIIRAALRAAAHSRRAKAPVAAQCGQAVDGGGRQRPAADV